MEVIKGKTFTAPKVMFYGLTGVGKSTLASKMKRPLFLDFEGGANQIGVDRTPVYNDLESCVRDIIEIYHKKDREYDTIVIDSVDWLVRKAVEQAAGIRSKDEKDPTKKKIDLTMTLNRSNGGYGNGKQVLENYIRSYLLPWLVELNKKGYGIVLIAHADKKTIMDAEGVDEERISPKFDINTMNVFVEWCDNVFYIKKNANDERVLVLESDNTALAKNRLGLTGEVKLSDIDINELLTPKEK